jgi:hypothetical protein
MQESSLLLLTNAEKVNLYLSTPQGHNRAFLASASDAGGGKDHDGVAVVPGKKPGTNRIHDKLDPRARVSDFYNKKFFCLYQNSKSGPSIQ